jgi:hypothetical protein
MKISKDNKRRLFITFIVLITVLLGALSSCSTLGKVVKKETVTNATEVVKTDNKEISTTRTSEAIQDRVVINVPESDNKELMDMFNSMMKQMNISKSSGTNSYNSKYNEELKQWVIDFTVAQTLNKEKEKVTDTKSEKTFEQSVDEYIKKIVIPWWIYLIAFVLLYPNIEKIIKTIVNIISKIVIPTRNIFK